MIIRKLQIEFDIDQREGLIPRYDAISTKRGTILHTGKSLHHTIRTGQTDLVENVLWSVNCLS